MTKLDVIYSYKAVGILSVMKNVANEYIENVYNTTSHNTLSTRMSCKRVGSVVQHPSSWTHTLLPAPERRPTAAEHGTP